MNHKRGRAKNQRAGCLICKPWKINGAKKNIGWVGKQQAKQDEADQFLFDDLSEEEDEA